MVDGPIVGIDGCPGGWYVLQGDADCVNITPGVHASFADTLAVLPTECVIAVDIPIGLRAAGSRECDSEARRFLGPKRGSSVFPAPLRAVLEASSHADASAIRRQIEGKGMSIQSFAITAKVRDVDAAMRAYPDRARQVFEIHPEVSFAALNGGQGLTTSKKRAAGRRERIQLLQPEFGELPARFVENRTRTLVEADDVLDAFAALWSARRILNGTAECLPVLPLHDELGLRMAIYY